jgi:hypothetical protein
LTTQAPRGWYEWRQTKEPITGRIIS